VSAGAALYLAGYGHTRANLLSCEAVGEGSDVAASRAPIVERMEQSG
jgi:hypothetical protein